jgi:hypothetical protein
MSKATSPADQLASLLPSSLVDSDTPTWALKVGQLTTEPDRLIVFFDTGGQTPNPRWKLDFLSVMVQIRGNPNDYTSGWQKGRQVRDFFLGITPQTLTSGDRIDGITMASELTHVGYDDQKRPIFSVNFRVFWEPGDTNTTSREPL